MSERHSYLKSAFHGEKKHRGTQGSNNNDRRTVLITAKYQESKNQSFFRNQHFAVVKIKISSRHHKFKKSEGGIGEVILAQLMDL